MRLLAALACALLLAPGPAPAGPELGDYLPEGIAYDPAVPKPADVLGFEVGEWHVRHDQLVDYMVTLAAASPRVELIETGRTHEGRRLLLLAISTVENIRNLEALRLAHLAEGERGELGDGPLVVWQGHSVHGNEASGSNMSLLLAYHLAAGGGAVEQMLADTIVLVDPSINPDGLARFAQWADGHRSKRPVGDPNNREHNEVWPNGRTNHYWFDLNRDWLLLTHPESRARVTQYHRWRPHVLTDFHEMGSNSTYFFQPGVPERRHPMTPERNHELTAQIGEYHARTLDAAGRLYYSAESFDDFYYGKGSTYPDVNGTIGILFEQASSRGHRMDTVHGTLTFPDTIGNQFLTALSTMAAADALRTELREWQAGFWTEALTLASDDAARAYVFGDAGDRARAMQLVDILTRHAIEVHALEEDVTIDEREYRAGAAWIVPLEQRQYRLIKAIFEYRTEFADETFYDVSAFNLPLAFNLPFDAMGKVFKDGRVGERVTAIDWTGEPFRPVANAVAYAFEWTGYYAPRALQRLLAGDFSAYVATTPMTVTAPDGAAELARGSIFVPLGLQGRRTPSAPGTAAAARPEDGRRADLAEILRLIALEDGIRIVPVMTGLTPRGVDMGSPTVRRVEPVRPLLVVGGGARGYDAGEVWHLLDTRVDLPLTLVEANRLQGIDLHDYTHVVLVDGQYKRFAKQWKPKLASWLKTGGVLIGTKRGAEWITQQGLDTAGDDNDEDRDDDARDERRADDKAKDKGKAKGQGKGKKNKDADEETVAEEADAESDDESTDEDPDRYRPYGDFRDERAKRVVGGAIFQVTLDTTHPIGFGFHDELVPVFRSATSVLEPSENPFQTVARYTAAPLLSGYASTERQEEIAGTAAIVVTRVGRGTVVRLIDNPNFRGIWYGTNKLFLNAIFFGRVIDTTNLEDRR